MSGSPENASIDALLLCNTPMVYAALKAAIDMKLFEIIESNEAAMSASEIASHLPNQYPGLPSRLNRLLLLLASHSLLTYSTTNDEVDATRTLYRVSPTGRYFLRGHNNGSLAPLIALSYHPAFLDVWPNFKDAILDDGNDGLFKKVHGKTMFQFMETDPTLNDTLSEAMANLSIVSMESILETYKGFEGISMLLDVGGGTGKNLNMIISKYPSIKGINFDLPHVIANASHYPGVEHVGGDMFASIPGGADAIILKNVCYNWSDEECLRILKNCEKALPENGKVIVVDYIMREVPESSDAFKFATCVDNKMLMFGGKERTEKEYEALSKASGFAKFQVLHCGFSAFILMEFYK